MAEPLNLDLLPASFRGIPFHVNGAGAEVGRRVQVHEYPQRDQPWSEDLGRATRGFTVDAFVIGERYIEDAQALMAAAEEEGAGTLVHPWLGTMEVQLKDLLRIRFDAEAGHALVGFSFVEPGELKFPLAEESTQLQSQLAADGMCFAAIESFASGFSIAGLPSFVGILAGLNISGALSFAGTLGSNFSALSSWAGGLVAIAKGGIAGVLGGIGLGGVGGIGALIGRTIGSLLSLPRDLAAGLMDLFDISGIVGVLASTRRGSSISISASTGRSNTTPTYAAVTAAGRVADPLSAIALGIVAIAGNGGAGGPLNAPVPVVGATAARQQQIQNTAAVNALVRRAMLAQAVGISSHIDATVQVDAFAVRNALCAALDAESLVADDIVYEALQVARKAVFVDITARATNGARLVDLTPAEVVPALVLAYDRYEDAARGDEIADRNGLIHPGFVPIKTLKVLSA